MDRDNSVMRQIIADTLWMARRYAHNRFTYAPTTVNEAIDAAENLGIKITEDKEIGKYADDGQLGKWDIELKRFVGEKH